MNRNEPLADRPDRRESLGEPRTAVAAVRGRQQDKRSYWPLVGWTALLLMAAFVGFQQLFSSMTAYDDEGYVLLSLRLFHAGRPLYDDVYSQYGPGFFLLQSTFHAVTGCEIGHDVARWKTLSLWLLTSGLCAWFVQRLTGRAWLAVLAFLLSFFHLDRLGLEPAHPQDVCLPLLVGLLVAATFLRGDRRDRSVILLLGTQLALLATIKLNLGLFAGLATVLALLTLTRPSWLSSGIQIAATAGALLLPLVLMGKNLFSMTGMQLPTVLLAGMIGLVLVQRELRHARPHGTWPVRNVLAVIGVTALVSLFVLATILCCGTSVAGLYRGMIGIHRNFAADSFSHAPLLPMAALWAAVVLAGLASRDSRESLVWKLCGAALAMIVLVSQSQLRESLFPPVHGLFDRGLSGWLASIVPPLAALVVLTKAATGSTETQREDEKTDNRREADEHCQSQDFGRTAARWMLAWNAVLQPLGIIPTPGTQLAIGTLPSLLLLLILVGDFGQFVAVPRFGRVAQRWMLATASLFVMATLLLRGGSLYERRSSRVSLDLPGAKLLRLPLEDVEPIRATVAALRHNASTFVTLPGGYNSLFLWSEMEPPTGCNITFWDLLLDRRHQQLVIEGVERAASPRLVVFPQRAPEIFSDAPLLRYLRSRFTVCESLGTVQIWARPSQINLCPSPES